MLLPHLENISQSSKCFSFFIHATICNFLTSTTHLACVQMTISFHMWYVNYCCCSILISFCFSFILSFSPHFTYHITIQFLFIEFDIDVFEIHFLLIHIRVCTYIWTYMLDVYNFVSDCLHSTLKWIDLYQT